MDMLRHNDQTEKLILQLMLQKTKKAAIHCTSRPKLQRILACPEVAVYEKVKIIIVGKTIN